MIKTLPPIDYTVIVPQAEVYDVSGERIGKVIELSGDRFRVVAGRHDAWVPNEWISAAHPHTVVVRFHAARIKQFARANSSRWSRR